jgi:hypothetical protein
METVENTNRIHNFTLDSFKKSQSAMIATSDNAYGSRFGNGQWVSRTKDYTEDEIKKVIESGSLIEQ